MRTRPDKTLAHRIDSPKAHIANNLRLKRDRIITKFCTIAHSTIQAAADNAQAQSLEAAIVADRWQNDGLTKIVCHKSGRTIATQSHESLTRLIATHGESRARELITIQWPHHTSPEWLATDHDSLRALIKIDPIGYWCYAAGMLFAPVIDHKSGQLTTPHDVYTDELCNSPAPTAQLAEMPAAQRIKMQSVTDRMNAHEALAQIPLELIIEQTQLLSRFWGLANPHNLIREGLFPRHLTLTRITSNETAFMGFRELLIAALQKLVERQIATRIQATDHRYVSFAEIGELQQANGGHAAFRLMQKRRPKTSIDADILTALQDFTMNTIFEDSPPPLPQPKPEPKPQSKPITSAITINVAAVAKHQTLTLAQILSKGKSK